MRAPRVPLPDVARADAGVAVLHRWVTAPNNQLTLADSSLETWANTPWPAGLIAVHVLVSTNGDTVLTYEQWAGAGELAAFQDDGRDTITKEITAPVPALEEFDPLVCTLHRGSPSHPVPARAGCLVLSTYGFESLGAARAWSRALASAEERGAGPTPGLLARHFLIGTGAGGGGVRLLDYAEWTGAHAHAAFLENGYERRCGTPTAGIIPGPARRCRAYGVLTAPLPGRTRARTW
ncbi:hypothetical protein [Streptomyces globisporus]|uniref:hypothetical protein n=1 Tax=Streptomyces globisporus TaxID=1908 RepID=UPI0036B332D2